jgi:hypothetical protein
MAELGRSLILERDHVAISFVRDIRNPLLIFEVPTDHLTRATLERPAAASQARVRCCRHQLHSTDRGRADPSRLLVRGADIVGLARPTPLQHAPDCGAMVRKVEPVTNVVAIAEGRQGFLGECAVNDKRDEYFRERASHRPRRSKHEETEIPPFHSR